MQPMMAYVVVWGHCGDCGQIKGIFSRPETARIYMNHLETERGYVYLPDELHIEEWEVKD